MRRIKCSVFNFLSLSICLKGKPFKVELQVPSDCTCPMLPQIQRTSPGVWKWLGPDFGSKIGIRAVCKGSDLHVFYGEPQHKKSSGRH